MRNLERFSLWGLLVATALVTAVNFGGFRQLTEIVGSNTADLDQPAVEPRIVAGIPTDPRKAWRMAKNNAQDAALTDQLWLTVLLTNAGSGQAGQVVADLSFVDPVVDLFVYTAGGQTLESAPFRRPTVSEGGLGKTEATVTFGKLPPGESHLIFVGLRPKSFDAASYDAADYIRWSHDFARAWNVVRITSAVNSLSHRETSVVEYSLGALAIPDTTAMPVNEVGAG